MHVFHVCNLPSLLNTIIPLQACICVSNEPPSDLKDNLTRAWGSFSQGRIDASSKPVLFKACLFGLSLFHSILLGRRKFGFQGWSSPYRFNMGDLSICTDILDRYLDQESTTVPWEDLRYIFGEIMYGGHITDFFDRRTNQTYLNMIFNPNLLKDGELVPDLLSPDANIYEYDDYENMIKCALPVESPLIYGKLHIYIYVSICSLI